MPEVDLMRRYPKSDRSALLDERAAVTDADREIARQFGKEYFDGPRHLGLGGYNYDPKYWEPVVKDMIVYYGLKPGSTVLDVGCGKGFMMLDFANRGMQVAGVDISDYCLRNAISGSRWSMKKASCDALPFADKSYDLVVSIATIHNLDVHGVMESLREIKRVSKGHAYIKVNGYRTEAERVALVKWNLVAKTILSVDSWKDVFKYTDYTGDYSFFTP
jgi:SAM-dependent methyltransferase